MATKFSDLVLDMETGDACLEDAYIASAKGRVNVSNAIFETAHKISELPEDRNFMIVQEAAEEGIPNTREGAIKTATQAVAHELSAYFDEVVAVAKKVKASAEKDLKVLIGIGKKVGVNAPADGDFEGSFAEPLGKAIIANGRMDLADKQFLKSKNTIKIAKGYAKGMAYILSAYGISISTAFTPAVKSFVGFDGTSRGSVDSLKALDSRLSDGGRALAVGGIDNTTDSIKAGDITDLAMALFVVANIASAVVDATKGAKKQADSVIASLCSKDCDGKKVSRTCESINGDIRKYAQNLQDISNAIATGYTNSVYTLTNAVSK